MPCPTPRSSTGTAFPVEVRRTYLRTLTSLLRAAFFWQAIHKACSLHLKFNPAEIVSAGRHGCAAPGQDDHGIAYTVGYRLRSIYLRAFTQTSPSDPEYPSNKYLNKFNMISYSIYVALNGLVAIWYLVEFCIDFQIVGFPKLPLYNKNWTTGFFMLFGVGISLIAGYGAFQLWETFDVPRFTPFDYAIIVIPHLIETGIKIGNKMQMKMEMFVAKMEALKID